MSGTVLKRLEAQAFEPGKFGHREHVIGAWEALRTYEFTEALHRYSHALRSFAEAAGAGDKFNVTMTVAFASLIAERMADDEAESGARFVDANPDLSRQALQKFYSPRRLSSPVAKDIFLLPDRRQLS